MVRGAGRGARMAGRGARGLFHGVKYYLSGDVPAQISELLRSGGGEQANYFSEFVSHLICGPDAPETIIAEAEELYEIPAVTGRWVIACVRLDRLVSVKPYSPTKGRTFSGVVACVSRISSEDAKALFALITYYGGRVKLNFDPECTHLISGSATGAKYAAALAMTGSSLRIVTPDWVIDSVKAGLCRPFELYHPDLLLSPPPIPHKSREEIRLITSQGFDFEEGIAKTEVPTHNRSDSGDLDSTMALVDKLKQRMPRNRPNSDPPLVPSQSLSSLSLSGQLRSTTPRAPPPPRLFSPQMAQSGNPQNQTSRASSPSVQTTLAAVGVQLQNRAHTPEGLNAIQIQQQRLMLQHQFRMQMQQNQNNQLHQQQMNQVTLPSNQSLGTPRPTNRNTGLPQQISTVNSNVNQLIQQTHVSPQSVNQNINQQGILNSKQIHGTIANQGNYANSIRTTVATPQSSQNISLDQRSSQVQNMNQQQNLIQQILHSQANQQLNQSSNPNLNKQENITINQIHSSNVPQNQAVNPGQLQTITSGINQTQNVQTNSNIIVQQQSGQVQQSPQMIQQLNQIQNQTSPQMTNQPNINAQIQSSWRQQQINHQPNIQMVQNPPQNTVPGQQNIRNNLLQQRTQLQQNQMILQQNQMLIQTQNMQQQILQNQNLQTQQLQQPNQHILQQTNQQIISQTNGQQHPNIQPNSQQQILVQKQLSQTGQVLGLSQQVNPSQQQILINQQVNNNNSILVQNNQHIPLQNNQQGASHVLTQPTNTQIISQNQQIISSAGQQIINQSGQVLTPGGTQLLNQGQQLITQNNQQILAQSNQQIVSQSHQIMNQNQLVQSGQQIGSQQQQILNQPPQIIQQTNQQPQIVTHPGGQQIIAQGGQQIVTQQGGQQMIWQQQQFLQRQQQIITGPSGTVGQRVTWPTGAGRQLIHLDAQTHAQLQQMNPQQRALFVAQLQKRRQLSSQRAIQQQVQHPTSHTLTLVRGQLTPGINQQQVQWVQQQGIQTVTPGASETTVIPGQQPQPQVQTQQVQSTPQPTQQQPPHQQQYAQLHLRHPQHQRLQRFHSQPNVPTQGSIPPRQIVGPPISDVSSQQSDPAIVQQQNIQPDQVNAVLPVGGAPPLVVHHRTKTALANMLSIRLQNTQPTHPQDVAEPSAAGTLRLMTAAHNAPPRAPEVVQTLQQRRAISSAQGALHHQLPVSPHTHQQPISKPAFSIAGKPGVINPGRAPTPAPPNVLPRVQFYGHNPNLKLPPDLFLLGCIFHIVEYGNNPSHNVKQWTEIVGRHGGEVEANYCPRVTHVLAQTQKHGVVMQALRDSKRCVTAYWLSDTMTRRQVVPPWQALHLPLMYALHDKPAQRHRASITGFSGEERDRVRFMIEHTGAKMTTYMSRDNTVLICRRPEGIKYQRARDWSIPTVSVQWLTDILLGNMSALSQIEQTKYQQFNTANPFRMDYTLVPHLMNPWKMPINITQESHERVKRGAIPTITPHKAKKPRLSQNTPVPWPISAPCIEKPDSLKAPRVLFSMIKNSEPFAAVIRHLGGFVVTHSSEATHIVMGRLVRTPKFISALINVKYILTTEWLIESQKIGKFAEEMKFPLRDESFDEMFRCDIANVINTPVEERTKLFNGITFYITPGVQPSRTVLTGIIEQCGGKVDKNRKSYVSIQEIHKEKPYSYLVLTAMNDLHLVYYLLQAEKNLNIVCSTEFVLSSVMNQKIDVLGHLVKID